MTQTDHPQEHVDLATAVRLTGLSARQIKRWQEMGIIGDSEGRIRFVDLRLLRSLASILTTRLSARRLNRALERLDTPANSLTTDGKSLLYRKHQALWHTETGQGQIDFEAQEQSAHTGTLVKIRHTTRQNEGLETNAEELHDLALSLEPTDPKAAQTAYLKALHPGSRARSITHKSRPPAPVTGSDIRRGPAISRSVAHRSQQLRSPL